MRRLDAGVPGARDRTESERAGTAARHGTAGVHGALAGALQYDDAPARPAHQAPGARHDRDAGGAELPAATLDALVARADGVPLYVEELTKAVMEPGAARGVEAIPASLADSLMGRLDRLSTAKEVAQRAAVLGREFGYPLLAATVGMDEPALRQGLARLVDAEILFALGEPPAATYTFKHALIQETAYQSLLKRTRQQLHARTAQVLEERFPERVAAGPEVVARHYDQAGLAAHAIAHYQRAGERATQRSANEEAIGHLRRALALVATLPATRERDQVEVGLQMAIGAPLTAARGWSHPENEQAYARARELASRIGDSPELPRVLSGVAAAYLIQGDLATAAEVAQEALAAAERSGEAFDRVSAHEEVGTSAVFQGHLSRALRHFERSIESYDPGRARAAGLPGGIRSWGILARVRGVVSHVSWSSRPGAVVERGFGGAGDARGTPVQSGECSRRRWTGPLRAPRVRPDARPRRRSLGSRRAAWVPAVPGTGAGVAGLGAGGSRARARRVSRRCSRRWTSWRTAPQRDHATPVARDARRGPLGGRRHDAAVARSTTASRKPATGPALLRCRVPGCGPRFSLTWTAVRSRRRRRSSTSRWTSPGGRRPRRWSCAPPPAWRGSGNARASAKPPAPCWRRYEWFTEGFDTRDLQDAKALLAALEPTGAER